MNETPHGDRRVAQYYHTARTAHVERVLSHSGDLALLYTKTRADFDIRLARESGRVHRVGVWGVLRYVSRRNIDTLEIAEPFAIRLWPQLLCVTAGVALIGVVRRRRVRLVAYCIENFSPALKLAEFTRLPLKVASLICSVVGGYLVRSSSKLVFGTKQAQQTYERALRGKAREIVERSALVWHLPARDMTESVKPSRKNGVVFLGTFEKRKGIEQLICAWNYLSEESQAPSDLHLTLMGKGGEIDVVREFAERNVSSVTLLEDPSRTRIFSELASAKVLVLFSQPAKGWKEQVGLPIVEGLAVGCEIVTSSETGIADWLRENGHEVLPPDATAEEVGEAIRRALAKSRTVSASLPTVDGRLAAAEELYNV